MKYDQENILNSTILEKIVNIKWCVSKVFQYILPIHRIGVNKQRTVCDRIPCPSVTKYLDEGNLMYKNRRLRIKANRCYVLRQQLTYFERTMKWTVFISFEVIIWCVNF